MKRVVSFLVLFTLFSPVVLSQAEPPPLLHVRLKIEGVQKKRSIASIHQALLSVPGVKRADLNVPKHWFFFNDYDNVYALVEFEHGTLTSETLIRAVERISGPKNIYKVKFVE